MRTLVGLTVFLMLPIFAVGQDPKTTFCNFDENNQVSAQYTSTIREEPHNGKVWSPGVTLYIQTPVTLGGSTLGLGAYSVHFIPDKKSWTIIVNKNVTAGATYNSAEDVTRATMGVGALPTQQKGLQLTFGHMAPKVCSLRADYQKTGAFVEFTQK